MARITQTAQAHVEVDDMYLIALAKQGDMTAYDRIVRRYYGFVRLKASSYFLAGGDGDDLIQEGLVGLYKAVRDYRSDRESSFRNFAELCITRQIITAVKTATRNKHTPLNSMCRSRRRPRARPTASRRSRRSSPGPRCTTRVCQVISSEELKALVGCLSTALSELESRGAVAVPGRSLLRGDRRATRHAIPRRSTTRCSGSSARSERTSSPEPC